MFRILKPNETSYDTRLHFLCRHGNRMCCLPLREASSSGWWQILCVRVKSCFFVSKKNKRTYNYVVICNWFYRGLQTSCEGHKHVCVHANVCKCIWNFTETITEVVLYLSKQDWQQTLYNLCTGDWIQTVSLWNEWKVQTCACTPKLKYICTVCMSHWCLMMKLW